ncbi:MAG TPA: AMP-binding protein [Pelovirga sp.]|nr:AMP-binding protein [Pelovirga sp.]
MRFLPCQLSQQAALEEIEERQLELLQAHLQYLQRRSPYYQRLFAARDFAPDQLTSMDQLHTLPLTGKAELATSNRDFLAVGEDEVVDICVTSGTTGEPVTLWQTETDLQRLAENERQAFVAAGITRHHRVLIGAALDRGFMAGLAYFLGLREIGATIIRAGSSSLEFLAETLKRQRPDVLVGVPSLFLTLARHLQRSGTDCTTLGVDKLICIGEPVRNPDLTLSPLGSSLAEYWSSQVLGTYAATEIATAFGDCEQGCGGHLLPELAVVEIIDEKGQLLGAGQVGEVVVTPLGVTGAPLLRYRTGDMAVLFDQSCACGRQTPRLGPILGRREQLLKCRGTSLFPATIAHALHSIAAIQGHYIEVYPEHDLADEVKVVVGCTDPTLTADQISARIAALTRVKLAVTICSPAEILRKTVRPERRKPIIFFDYRPAHQQQKESL